MINRLFAFLILALIVVLLVASGMAIVTNLGQSNGSTTTTLPALEAGQVPTGKSEEELGLEDIRPSMTFEADRLESSQRLLTGAAILSMPPGMDSDMFDARTKQPIFTCDAKGNNCVLKPQYANNQVVIELIGATTNGFDYWDFTKAIPFKDVFGATGLFGKTTIPVDVPLAGNPSLYPQDSYFVDLAMQFSTPGVVRLRHGKPPTGKFDDKYFFDSATEGKTDVVKAPPISYNGSTFNDSFHVTIHRPTVTQVYVYAVSLIPIIFFLVFFHILFLSKDQEKRRFEEFAEALIVGILAVLPLRIVIVPPEIEGITRVDIILAIGLVLITGVAFGRYATNLLGIDRIAPEAEAETPPAAAHAAAPAE